MGKQQMDGPSAPPRSKAQAHALDQASEKGLITRRALLEVAAQLFAEKGYIQTSLRDIAKRAGVTTGALYGHFRNKADLLAEVINARIIEEFGDAGIRPKDRPDRQAMLHSLATHYTQRRELRTLIVQGSAAAQVDEGTRESLRIEQLAHLERWFAGYEADRVAMKVDPAVDLEAAVLFTWAAELGLGLLEVLGITPSPDGWADAYSRLMRGLTLPPESG